MNNNVAMIKQGAALISTLLVAAMVWMVNPALADPIPVSLCNGGQAGTTSMDSGDCPTSSQSSSTTQTSPHPTTTSNTTNTYSSQPSRTSYAAPTPVPTRVPTQVHQVTYVNPKPTVVVKTQTVYQEPKKEVKYVPTYTAAKTVTVVPVSEGCPAGTQLKGHNQCVPAYSSGCPEGTQLKGHNECVVYESNQTVLAATPVPVPTELPSTGPGAATAVSLFGIVGSLIAYKFKFWRR